MRPPYLPGQTLAWLTPDPDGLRVHRATVAAVEPGPDSTRWRVVTDRGEATVDATGQAGHVLPMDVDLARELYVHGGESYLVRPTTMDSQQVLDRDHRELDSSLDLDGDLASTDRDDELLSLDELCEWLKLSKNTVYKQRSEGTGPPAYRIGKHLRFMRAEVLIWLASKRDSPADDLGATIPWSRRP